MINNCIRCHRPEEIHRTKNPNHKVKRYYRAKSSLAKLGVVMKPTSLRKRLCLGCLEDLLDWVTKCSLQGRTVRFNKGGAPAIRT